jgi:hypothetical protein
LVEKLNLATNILIVQIALRVNTVASNGFCSKCMISEVTRDDDLEFLSSLIRLQCNS